MEYVRARLVKLGDYHFLVLIHGNNGSYHELPVLDAYSAEQILFDFCKANRFICVEKAGFDPGQYEDYTRGWARRPIEDRAERKQAPAQTAERRQRRAI